jgi:cation:H+ antiporter
VFNILSVIGATAIIRPVHLPGGFWESGLVIDYTVMVAISFLPLVLMRRKLTLGRNGGMLLLACYAGYFAYLEAVSFQ